MSKSEPAEQRKTASQHVTCVLTIVVKYDHTEDYENWLKECRITMDRQPGFLSMEVLTPSQVLAPEYFIILRFDSLERLTVWQESLALAQLTATSRPFVVNTHVGKKQLGTEMLFSRPVTNVYYPKPPFWKQTVVGVLTVYPLILISSQTIGVLLAKLNFHPQLGLFVSICILSPMIAIVMPRVSKFLSGWLYPKAKGG